MWFKMDLIGSKYIELLQTGSNWIKLDQIGSNWIKMDQIGFNLIQIDQTISSPKSCPLSTLSSESD